jgi:hypothetical protein
MKRALAAGAAFSLAVAPWAEAACWRVTPDADRCGDVRGLGEGFAQFIVTGTSSGAPSLSMSDPNSGVEYKGALWSGGPYHRQDTGDPMLDYFIAVKST